MRVRVDCDPPLLADVLELALSRIDGVELSREAAHAAARDASREAARVARDSPRPAGTITLDETTELPRLVDEVAAWVFQTDSREFTLFVSGKPRDHCATSSNSEGAKPNQLER